MCTCVFVISYIYNVPIFLLFMDSFCSFFVHVRLRSFRSMTSFFCSCPAPAFRIYDPFEFRFVCFVSRSKVKKFDDQACPFFVHVRLRSFRSMHPPPPTPSVPFYLYCICEGGGGRGQGGPWPMGDSGSCSGVLKYAVTWYCISTFTSLHRGLEGWGGGGESGETRIEWWGEDRETNLKRNNFDITV